jgi:signal transduction histidine kinase
VPRATSDLRSIPEEAPPPYARSMSTETETERPRGWTRAWGETWRLLAALGSGLLISVVVWFGDPAVEQDLGEMRFGLFVLLDVAVGLTALVLLPLRHRAPLVLTLVVVAITGVSPLGVGAAAVMLISLATRRRVVEIVAAATVFVASGVLAETFVFRSEPSAPLWQILLATTVVGALLVVIGLYIGGRRELLRSLRERTRLVEEEEQLRLAQARDHERTRIAREMHDVLAHRLSLVALHAGALEYRDGLDAAETRATAGVIRENARTALTELRDVLGVLRDPDPGGAVAVAPPQPTLAGIGALLDEARAAGTVVHLESSLPDGALGGVGARGSGAGRDGRDVPDEEAPPTTISRHAFRIVQECLTNARRHAPGQPVTVRLDGRAGRELVVRVENPVGSPGSGALVTGSAPTSVDGPLAPSGPGAPSGTPALPGGHGLEGLAERARLVGGHLTVDASGGRHVVEARLPWTR